MPHYKTLIDTAYVGQWDLPDRDVIVTIAAVGPYTPEVKRKKKLPDGRYVDEPRKRILITFAAPARKPWLAGPVSQSAIAAMYGPNTDDWIGKKIALYKDLDVMMGRVKTGGVRVRPTIPKGAPSTDPLDRPVDPEAAARIEEATGREPGED